MNEGERLKPIKSSIKRAKHRNQSNKIKVLGGVIEELKRELIRFESNYVGGVFIHEIKDVLVAYACDYAMLGETIVGPLEHKKIFRSKIADDFEG